MINYTGIVFYVIHKIVLFLKNYNIILHKYSYYIME